MKKFGRHIKQITKTSRDVSCEDERIIYTPERFNSDVKFECDSNKLMNNQKVCSSIIYTNIIIGLSTMFFVITAIFRSVWIFTIHIMIPTIRYNVLPILFGLTKSFKSIFRFVSKETGKAIEDTKKDYRNNTTNWP